MRAFHIPGIPLLAVGFTTVLPEESQPDLLSEHSLTLLLLWGLGQPTLFCNANRNTPCKDTCGRHLNYLTAISS